MNTWKVITFGIIAAILLVWLYPYRSLKNHGKKEIVMWGPGSGFSNMEQVIHRFEKENPEYKIVHGQMAARNIDPQRFLCSVAGDMPPDLIKFDRFAVCEWAARGAFEPLNKFLEIDKNKTNLKYHVDTKNIVRPALEEVTYKGNIYGVPDSANNRFLYYNCDILIREGFVDKNGNARPPKTWEELENYAVKLTKFDKNGNIKRLGFAPNFGNSWLYMYAWQNGGEFMTSNGLTCTLNSQRVVEALEFMTRVYDKLGGAKKVYAFESTFQINSPLDPFLNEKVAMKIDGDWFLQVIATFKPDLNFAGAKAPLPKARLNEGMEPITWLGGYCLSIPAGAKNMEGAWKMIRWLTSLEAAKISSEEAAELNASQGRTYIPQISCNKDFNEYMFNTYVKDNENLSDNLKSVLQLSTKMLPNAKYRPVTPVGQLLWNQHISAFENAIYHKYPTAKSALDDATMIVQKELNRYHNPKEGLEIKWSWLIIIYLTVLVITIIIIILWQTFTIGNKGYFRRQWFAGVFCASPWIIGFAIFTGGPILFSIIMSFCHYDILSPAHWVGLDNFRWIFTQDPLFWKALWNTVFMIIGVPIGLVVSLSIAILLNQKMKGMAIYRTLFYLPAIVPAVASSLLWLWIFNPSHGLLNIALAKIGIVGPAWLQDEAWSKPSIILMGLWAAGSGMIIWIAGLKGIPKHLYEAAEVDGAGAWKKFINITLPMLSPYIFFNIIMGLIGTFQIFAQAYIMTEGGPVNSTLFYAYHLFNNAFRFLQMGEASAMAWVLFSIVFSLTMFQLWLSKKWVHYGGN